MFQFFQDDRKSVCNLPAQRLCEFAMNSLAKRGKMRYNNGIH